MGDTLPVELYAYCGQARLTHNLSVDDIDERVKFQQISTDKREEQLDLALYRAVWGLTIDRVNDIADELSELELLLVDVIWKLR